MDEFAKGETRKFFKDKEKSLSILDKYWLVPKLVSESGETFDKDGQVWQSLVELARMRNEFVHSKSDRTGYYLAYSQTEWEPLNRSNSPEGWEGREGEYLHQTLQIPRDPYSFLPEHVDRIDEATREIIVELNRLLAGAVTKDSWLTQSHERSRLSHRRETTSGASESEPTLLVQRRSMEQVHRIAQRIERPPIPH